MANQNKTIRNRTLYILKMLYRVLRERSNITVSFAEHLKFQETMTSTHSIWVNSDKSKENQLEIGHYMFWNYYIQGATWTEPYHSSFAGAAKISRKTEFYGFT